MTRQEEMLSNYVYYIQKITDQYYADMNFSTQNCKVSVNMGRKFAKIVKTNEGGGTSVHSFVELSTGNVYKAASWNSRAKHVRANINDYESLKRGVNHHGANYLV